MCLSAKSKFQLKQTSIRNHKQVLEMSYGDLPLLNELLKPHYCVPSKTPPVCKCKDFKGQKHAPCKKLENWKEWMNRRKKIRLKLEEVLQREPGTLVMDQPEQIRTVVERRSVIEHAQVVQDKKVAVPPSEYVAVPNKILDEKGVDPTKRTITTWTKSGYFKSRCEELSFGIRTVEPHKPELSNLCIEGFSLNKKKPSSPKKEKPTFILTPKQEETVKKCRVSLSINGVTFTPIANQVSTRKVYIMFDYDTTSEKVATEYFSIENIGDAAVHYSWVEVEEIPLFRDILPKKERTTYFCFNKNTGVVIPRQTVNIPIWFKVEKPGVYFEKWEFCTKPKILSADSKLVVAFHASAVVGDLEEQMQRVRDLLDTSVRNQLIEDTLSTLMSNVKYEKFKPTVYCYDKKEVFEAMSETCDTTNTFPQYRYNKDVVRELQKFYKNVRRSTDPKSWNYNIYELKLLTNAKQKSVENEKYEADEKIKKKLESSCPTLSLLQSPQTVFPETFSDIKLPSGSADLSADELIGLKQQLGDTTVSLNDELEKILFKLERPNTSFNFETDKYNKAYLLLCTCFNEIENEIENLRSKLAIDKEENYPNISPAPIFHQYEHLQDVFIKPTLRDNLFDVRYRPANEALEQIPANECALRHKLYFNVSDSPKPGKKEAPKPAPKKPNDPKNKADKPPEEEDDGYPINEAFDPYAKVKLVPFKDIERDIEEDEKVPVEPPANIIVLRQHYKYYVYVIVYNSLQEAIGNIVDMLEMYSVKRVSHPVIKEIEEPNYRKRLIDLKSLIIQENLDNVKAKMILNYYRMNSKLNWKAIEAKNELRRMKSVSSLCSILKPYQKPKFYDEKPISYPRDIYESEIDISTTVKELVEKTTSTLDAQIDDTWEDFKEVSVQRNYDADQEIDDLEAYIEKVKSETSVHSLIDYKFDKETQKDLNSHVSDEEHFYYVITDSEISDISVESDESESYSRENAQQISADSFK